MTPEEYDFLYQLEEHHWWFRGMRKIVAALLDGRLPSGPLRILDAGRGTGLMLSWLKSLSSRAEVVGLDVSPHALRYCRQRGKNLLICASVADIPLASETFDLITTLDVIDVFPFDAAERAFAELARVLKKGGLLLVRVPAFQWLYSEHDKAVFAAHRYTAKELAQSLARQGLVLQRVTYANTLLFPLAAVWRWLHRRPRRQPRSDVRPLPRLLRWTNPLLGQMLGIEGTWLKHFPWRLPVGLSVLALARKPNCD